MTDHDARRQPTPTPDQVDPDRPRGDNPFDQPDDFTGEDYDIGRERAEGRAVPSGEEDRVQTGGVPATPPEGDNRASFDARTGAVHEPRLPEDGGLPSA